MSALVSAKEHAMSILHRVQKTISVFRIQNTWRALKVEQMSEIERARSKMHKVENSMNFGPSWMREEAKCDGIKELWENVEEKKKQDRLTFGTENEARTSNGFTYKESLESDDGDKKGTTKFTLLVNSWCSFAGEKKYFFDGYAKKWADDPSSEDWDKYFERVIQLLEHHVPVILWGATGGNKRLGSFEKEMVKDLRNYWELYKIKKEIAEMKDSFHYQNEQPVCYAFPV